MSAPRILVIHPGHLFSTSDVYDGLVAGLKANGADVVTFPLDRTLHKAGALMHAGEVYGLPAELMPHDMYALAAQGIPGVAMHQDVDIAIAVTGSNLPWTIPLTLKRGGILTALLCTESPYLTKSREMHDAAVYDAVFTNERNAVPLFTRNAPGTVHYIPHAYNPAVHQPGPVEDDKVCDALFIGTGFEERQALFDGVDWADIHRVILGTMWDGVGTVEQLLSRLTANEDTAAWYRSAHITINHHRTTGQYGDGTHIQAGDAASLGPRAYEIAACGGFQVCDDSRAEAGDVFGDTLPTYRSGDSADLERVIRFYLARPDERDRLAAAQHQAIVPHTWTARAAQLLSILTTARGRRARIAA